MYVVILRFALRSSYKHLVHIYKYTYNVSYTWLSIHLLDTLAIVSLSKNLWRKVVARTCRILQEILQILKFSKENIPNI